jgi:hypothetical protein
VIRWRRKQRDIPESTNSAEDLAEARRARETSEQGLAQVNDRWPEINRLGEAHRQHQQQNHFLELFEGALRAVKGGGGDPARG